MFAIIFLCLVSEGCLFVLSYCISQLAPNFDHGTLAVATPLQMGWGIADFPIMVTLQGIISHLFLLLLPTALVEQVITSNFLSSCSLALHKSFSDNWIQFFKDPGICCVWTQHVIKWRILLLKRCLWSWSMVSLSRSKHAYLNISSKISLLGHKSF